MKLLPILLITSLLPAQVVVRRAISPSPTNSWARVVVDDDSSDSARIRDTEGVWIGDAQGRSVPYMWESDTKWSAIPLQTLHPIFGKDAKGQPTAAFTLHPPEGFSRGDREQVKLDLSLEASATPWACRVGLERRGDGGAFIAVDDDTPRFIYDLGPDRRATSITIPWDADDYRITLLPVQGAAPKLRGVDASACTLPSELKADERVDLVFHPAIKGDGFKDMAHADLDRPGKLIALEVTLQPPVAPVLVGVDSIHPDRNGAIYEPYALGSAELWNLPALGTMSTHIPIDGPEVEHLHLRLPDGVAIQAATALIRHRRLFFPAEAGQAYFLHIGLITNLAPGNLSQLPTSSRTFYTGTALALGAAEPDPQALLPTPDPAARLRNLLPWAVGLLILLLGFWGLRLMRKPPAPDLH